jgi:putative oxidoreductase
MWLFRTGSTRQVSAGDRAASHTRGLVFVAHGAQKIFSMGLPAITQGFTQYGIPFPSLTAPMISFLELVGGALLVPGLLTRVWAALLVCDMIGAIGFVHLKAGFFLPQGYEFALTMGVTMATLLLTGAGAYSLDAVIAGRGERTALEPGDLQAATPARAPSRVLTAPPEAALGDAARSTGAPQGVHEPLTAAGQRVGRAAAPAFVSCRSSADASVTGASHARARQT